MNFIRVFLSKINKGDTFYGLILADYVKERLGRKDMFPDTVLRYLRTLKQDGEVDFAVENRKESRYIKL